jgi:hypothetical protein
MTAGPLTRPEAMRWRGHQGLPRVQDQARPGLASEHLLDGLVDPAQRAGLVDHPGPARGVQSEHVIEVGAGTDDRAQYGLPVQHRVEHRKAERAVRGQGDEHQPAAAAQAGVGGREGLVADSQPDGHVGAAVRLQDRCRVLGPGVDDKVGAEFLGQLQLLVGDISGRDRAAEDLRVLQPPGPAAWPKSRWPGTEVLSARDLRPCCIGPGSREAKGNAKSSAGPRARQDEGGNRNAQKDI